MDTVPDFGPFDCGENVTLIAQFAPAATLVPQVEVMPNWPVAFMEEIVSAVLPVLVRMTVCGGLVVPTVTFLKFSGVVGEKLTTPVLRSTMTLPFRKLVTATSAFLSPLSLPPLRN